MDIRTKILIRQLSWNRLLNYLKLKLSYYLSSLVKKPIHWGSPAAVSIEPTTACNLRCPQCPSGLRQFSRPTGNLKLETNLEILEGLGKNLQYINYYFQGEPFIHPDFLNMVKQAADRNIYVVTSTNAHFIDQYKAHQIIDSGLTEMIISIDGMTQETYENYRINGKLEKVLEGTETMVQVKKERKSRFPILTFQFLVSRQNEHEIEQAKALAKEMQVDRILFKTVQIYDFENGNDLIPENEKYSRYKKLDNGKYVLKNRYRNSCWRMWSSCVFTWDGGVVPCCFDKDAEHRFGEIKQSNFKDIWRNSIYKEFRNKVFEDRRQIEICKNCSEGSKVWI